VQRVMIRAQASRRGLIQHQTRAKYEVLTTNNPTTLMRSPLKNDYTTTRGGGGGERHCNLVMMNGFGPAQPSCFGTCNWAGPQESGFAYQSQRGQDQLAK
jgi:hypothetical protein